MRLNTVELSWFRGGAAPVSLDLDGRSHVVYGANGSGKSSFVDAVEYALRDGRIGHLSHEYSGRHQERGVLNTHRPEGESALLRFIRSDGAEHVIRISANGSHEHAGSGRLDWDYRRTVLRQDEVSAFIHDTKGKKYSALLPLLGLDDLEIAAENIRKTRLSVERLSELDRKKDELQRARREATEVFGDSTPTAIHDRLCGLVAKYLLSAPTLSNDSASMLSACGHLATAFESRVRGSSQDQKAYAAHQGLARSALAKDIDATAQANSGLAAHLEPLIVEQLKVLEAAQEYVDASDEDGDIECPTCGTSVSRTALRAHLDAQHARLRDAGAANAACRTARARLAQTVANVQELIRREEITIWLQRHPELAEATQRASSLDPEAIRTFCDGTTLSAIAACLPIIAEASAAASAAPPDVVEVVTDRSTMVAAEAAISLEGLSREVRDADDLVALLRGLEDSIRDRIRSRSEQVIGDISADIQRLWAILHPGEPIQHITLLLPSDADKAIDIGLSFFGVTQDSPRLTLSEGHRNSLGDPSPNVGPVRIGGSWVNVHPLAG